MAGLSPNPELQEMTLILCVYRQCKLQGECEISPHGLMCCVDPELLLLFWKTLEPLGGGAALEEVVR